ncbi:hypothetical protein BaRGS_00023486 [Batillaria attramentaria]|uniref:Uncharacterized protein n=1 Tax=Batillaria attramentaria TaxID=370345 RepID=A0ABD0KDP8_9CAEN
MQLNIIPLPCSPTQKSWAHKAQYSTNPSTVPLIDRYAFAGEPKELFILSTTELHRRAKFPRFCLETLAPAGMR